LHCRAGAALQIQIPAPQIQAFIAVHIVTYGIDGFSHTISGGLPECAWVGAGSNDFSATMPCT
jgi:hypothetical protein